MADRPVIWREIYRVVRGDIANQIFVTGDKLPTEKELADRFAVNRHTVRRALAELAGEGAIFIRRGSGAYVAEGVVEDPGDDRIRLRLSAAALATPPEAPARGFEIVEPTAEEARRLGLGSGDPVIRVESVVEVDRLPVAFVRQLLPERRMPDFLEALHESGVAASALRAIGVTDRRPAWSRVVATTPPRDVAQALLQPETHPVLRVETLNLDLAGRPVELATSWFAGRRVEILAEAPRPGGGAAGRRRGGRDGEGAGP